ncbi:MULTISPECIES: hypothetical protein [Staphylococcus]|uniref:hypothetical protein n=1 Tax=Staphylococcus TaxID=1279 RepID=UPI000F831AFF|nr:hypothetical protein [Staphylococcus argenteus]
MTQKNNNLPKHPYLYFEDREFRIQLLSGKKIIGKLIANYQYDILIEAKLKNKSGDTVVSEMIIPKHAIEFASRVKK